MNEPRRAAAIAAAIVIVAAAFRLYGVADQPLLSDEVEAAATALHYVQSGQFGPTMWYHPDLRNLLLWCVTEAFGQGPLALRSISLLLAILSVPLTGLLLHALTRDRTAALTASFLLAVDQVHVALSRQAIQETWTAFFLLLGTYLAVLAWQRRSPWPLVAAGLAFGLGISSKFHALIPLATCATAGLVFAWRERSPSKAAWVTACLGVLPAVVFLLTYLPWFARGYGFADWLDMQRALLVKMAGHAGNPMDQVVDKAAWQWFLRPMGYAAFTFSTGAPLVTVAYSNPAVWLLVLPSTVFVARRAAASSAPAADGSVGGTRFVLLIFLASYLPLALSSRPIWLLSSLAVLPFALMLVALAASHVLRAGAKARLALAAYGVLVVAIALALYPMSIGRGRSHAYLRPIVERFRPPFEQPGVTP